MMIGSTPTSSNEALELDEESALLLAGGGNSALTEALVQGGDGNGSDGEDEIQPGRATYGSTEPAIAPAAVDLKQANELKAAEEGEEPKEPKKGKKQKAVSDALKTDMAAERTFFKWLWTGLHTGAIGSFIFITFDGDKSDPMRLVVVGFSWIVALSLVLYGTFAYYRRRRALRTGDLSVVPVFTREHSPLVVLVALALVIGVALAYATRSGFEPSKTAASTLNGV